MSTQHDLFIVHRERYVQAYRRVKVLEQQAAERLRRTILVPFFGGCMCRMHNCQVNYETGRAESSIVVAGRTYSHQEQVKIARRYQREQHRIWDECRRLSDAFASHF